MKKIISAVLLLFAAALAFSAPVEAREYSAANPPKPGERARAVLRALNAAQNPVYLKYRTRTEDGSATVTFASSGGMAYTDVESPGGRISTLYDARTQNVTIISHDTKSYVVAPSAPAVVPFEETLERAAGDGVFVLDRRQLYGVRVARREAVSVRRGQNEDGAPGLVVGQRQRADAPACDGRGG